MPDRAAIDAFHEQLVGKGVEVLGAPASLDGPFGGYGFEVMDPDRRRLRISADLDMRSPDDVYAYPRKISHVVLNSPNMEGAQAWYETMLGFRPSDHSADQMADRQDDLRLWRSNIRVWLPRGSRAAMM